ncbi:MAG: type II secretion system protein [Phycisphaerales bacterium]
MRRSVKGSARRCAKAMGGEGTQIVNRKSSIVNPDGFTLIELLVVISIVVLLMAVLLPTLGRARKQARAVACQARLRQWGLVFSMYFDDSDRRYPLAEICRNDPWWFSPRSYCSGSRDLLLCPMATRYEDNENDPYRDKDYSLGSKYTTWMHSISVGTGQAAEETYYGSYGLNYLLDAVDTVGGYTAQTPLLLDCAGSGVMPRPNDGPPVFDGQLPGGVGALSHACIDRHQGGINGLFCGMTVRKIGLKELWTLNWHPKWHKYDAMNHWIKASGVQPEDWPAWMRGFKDY